MTLPSEELDQWVAVRGLEREIERVSRQMKIEWPVLVDDWADIASEIVVILVKRRYATRVMDFEPNVRRSVLRRIARVISNEMRNDFDHFNGNFKYSTTEVRRLLEDGAIERAISNEIGDGIASDWAAVAGDGREEFGKQVVVEPFDVRSAFPRLPKHHREILVRRFVAQEQNLNNLERMAVTRAVDALTDLMNRAWRKAAAEHDGPGAREVISNGQAIYKNRSQE